MKWTKNELITKEYVTFDEDIEFTEDALVNQSRIISIKDLHVEGEGSYDEYQDIFEVSMHITGILVVPCAITNEPVEVDLDSEYEERFAFHKDNDLDVHVLKNDVVELLPIIFQLISLDVPLRIVKEEVAEYPKGDGWRVLSEDEYQKAKHDQVDPRLAKLKVFKAEG